MGLVFSGRFRKKSKCA